MPEKIFTKTVTCPDTCGKGEECKFSITISWEEVKEPDGKWYVKAFVFELAREEGSVGCEGDFHTGYGQFEIVLKGGKKISIDQNNVWDQLFYAVDPKTGGPESPGGVNVEYRGEDKKPIPDKKGGEPYKISYTKGLIESFHIHIKILCLCLCREDNSQKKAEFIRVDADFPYQHPCDGIRRLVDEGWKDGTAANADENQAITFAKNASVAKAKNEAKSREQVHTCEQPCGTPQFEIDVPPPPGKPIVDQQGALHEATIAAHWSLFLTCR